MKKSSFNTNVEKMRRITNSLEQKGDTVQLRYIRDGLYHVGGIRFFTEVKKILEKKRLEKEILYKYLNTSEKFKDSSISKKINFYILFNSLLNLSTKDKNISEIFKQTILEKINITDENKAKLLLISTDKNSNLNLEVGDRAINKSFVSDKIEELNNKKSFKSPINVLFESDCNDIIRDLMPTIFFNYRYYRKLQENKIITYLNNSKYYKNIKGENLQQCIANIYIKYFLDYKKIFNKNNADSLGNIFYNESKSIEWFNEWFSLNKNPCNINYISNIKPAIRKINLENINYEFPESLL